MRTVELDTKNLFAVVVNGKKVYCKGANWIPADALAGRISKEKTRDLLQSAVDANMNMIRVWGGGRYEADWFYDLCDELGLMVWQDFMFSCNIYPSDRDYLANVRAEAVENIQRLQHHACLALWCGDNELVGALTWFEETRNDRDRYLANYDRLNRTLEEALHDTDPGANWWPSSPCAGPLNFADTWHNDGSGDMHFWSVWHEGRDFEHYRDVAPRFCSEFGFQSYPSMDVINSFAAPADHNIAAPVLEALDQFVFERQLHRQLEELLSEPSHPLPVDEASEDLGDPLDRPGLTLERITRDGEVWRLPPRWSPDSKKLAFGDMRQRLRWVDVETGELTDVDRGDYASIDEYRWSPDSRWLAYYARDTGLMKIPVDGGPTQKIATASATRRPAAGRVEDQVPILLLDPRLRLLNGHAKCSFLGLRQNGQSYGRCNRLTGPLPLLASF